MKNVFWILAVCLSLGIYGCSNNSSEKVATIEETTNIITDNTTITEEASSVVDSLVSVTESEQIAENIVDEAKESKTETIKEIKKEVAKPVAKPSTKPASTKNEVKSTTNTSSKPKPATTSTTPTPKPKPAVKNEVAPPPPPPKPVAQVDPPKPVEIVEEVEEEVKEVPAPQLDHSPWDALLRKNVSSAGVVNYGAFKSDKSKLEAYLKHLEEFAPQSSWSKNKKMAYWFNLYNAWTVKTIVDSYPVSSIMDIDGGKTWDVKRVKSGSNTYSLSHVENEIIRPRFNDGRIHFAVNCAAKSCPPLLNRAWTEANTSSNLEKMTKAFVNNSTHNTISAKNIKISKIFEWYAADFGDLITYLNKYSNVKIDKDAKVEYLEYDWALNGK